MIQINKIKKRLVKDMKELNTYNKNYDLIIDITSRLIYDYEVAKENFEKSGAKITVSYTNKNGSKNLVKNPFYLALEKLRDDIVVHLRELGLTPYGTKKLNQNLKETNKEKSKLESFLDSELI